MKRFFVLLAWLPLLAANAQTALDDITANPQRGGSNHYAYPGPLRPQTPAPKGYKPVYISHYARHGSRYLINAKDYTSPAKTLRKAASYGKLTADGLRVLASVDSVERLARGRYGDLTPLGAQQHQGIGRRMVENFPNVFRKGAAIDARSTTVYRCVLSMLNELLAIQSLTKDITVTTDASQHDMYYMNGTSYADLGKKYRGSEAEKHIFGLLWERCIRPDRLMSALFNDPAYVSDSIDAGSFYYKLFYVAADMQSVDSTLDIFWAYTPEEIHALWANDNMGWFVAHGNADASSCKMPFQKADLLRNILDTADECLKKDIPGATLRFGHDVVVVPLASLMELSDANRTHKADETTGDLWKTYEVTPMACNIQMVFYRKKKSDDILVKVMLNENEQTLPVSSDLAPYYHWRDVEQYYRNKLNTFEP